MKEAQHQFLRLAGQPPARLTVEEVAWLLGCQLHDVPVLITAKLIKPLGNPPPNGTKFFAMKDLMELTKDAGWLAKVSNAIVQHWHKKNLRKRSRANGASPGRLDSMTDEAQTDEVANAR